MTGGAADQLRRLQGWFLGDALAGVPHVGPELTPLVSACEQWAQADEAGHFVCYPSLGITGATQGATASGPLRILANHPLNPFLQAAPPIWRAKVDGVGATLTQDKGFSLRHSVSIHFCKQSPDTCVQNRTESLWPSWSGGVVKSL